MEIVGGYSALISIHFYLLDRVVNIELLIFRELGQGFTTQISCWAQNFWISKGQNWVVFTYLAHLSIKQTCWMHKILGFAGQIKSFHRLIFAVDSWIRVWPGQYFKINGVSPDHKAWMPNVVYPWVIRPWTLRRGLGAHGRKRYRSPQGRRPSECYPRYPRGCCIEGRPRNQLILWKMKT